MNTWVQNAEGPETAQRPHKESPDNDFSHEVIGAAVEVQRVLGTGLVESAYAAALAIELGDRGLVFARDVPIEGMYRGLPLGVVFRADFVVQGCLLVQVKAVDALTDAHRAQLLSCLRVSDIKLGLLINFHAFPVVKGIHRVVNKL